MVRHSEQVCITLESVSKSPDGITKVRGVRSLNICPIISGGTTAIAAGIALAVPETEEIGVCRRMENDEAPKLTTECRRGFFLSKIACQDISEKNSQPIVMKVKDSLKTH